MTSLKQKTLSGLKWSAIERLFSQGLNFIITLIIARILSPSDYGIIGMLAIFLGISQVFIDAGFASAIIRKQDRSDIDFSTVFFYNIIVSFLFYILLFSSAPFVAGFYKMPILIPVTRIVGLNIVIGAFGTMHRTKLNLAVDFKTQTKISLITLLISGTAGILLALKGIGVWALIIQGLAATIVTTGLLWLFIKWKPSWIFSRSSFRELIGFGFKLMLSGLLDSVYTNIYQMVIGKHYNATDLGYYTRANGIAQMPASVTTGIIQRVTYPILSEIQDDSLRLVNSYRRLLKMSAFIIFPLMALLAALGQPLVRLLLTDKWLPAVPLMQVLCFCYMFYPIHSINLNLLKVKGRSNLFLRLEVIKKLMITVVLIVSFSFGILAICLGTVLTSFLALIINTYYTGQIIQMGLFKQMRDIIPILIISAFAGVAAYLPSVFISLPLLQILAGGIAGITVYLVIAFLIKTEEMKDMVALVFNRT